MAGQAMGPVPASSRLKPLPQVLRPIQIQRNPCGSGFSRERAGTVHTKPSFIKQNARAKNRYLPPKMSWF
ncbi:protein of unknown function [Pseudomonas sp. JV551A1]|nr:protein of unknown function [Pseudomonas sp. JV551A1]